MQSYRDKVESAWKDPSFFKDMIIGLSTAIVVVDDVGTIRLLNRKAEGFFGWKQEELANQPCFFIVTNREEHHHIFFKNLIATKKINKDSTIVETKTGERFLIDYSAEPIYDDEGCFFGFILSFSEKTYDLDAVYNDSLKELSDLKFAIDQSMIVAITDDNGVIQYANEKFCEISNYRKRS
ncbi:MAG: PAS domain-containing protein [Bacillaceae bacterium]|nr:PAS domain-containing protein [Bacillaceae bacterium]